MIYGSFSPPHFTIKSVDGLLNGDTLGGTVIVSSVATTATAQSGVGVYPAAVTLSGSSRGRLCPYRHGRFFRYRACSADLDCKEC